MSSSKEISTERLAALAAAYGGDPARWPEGERAAARRLVAADPEARRVAADAALLDRLLDAAPDAPPAPAALAGRILQAAPKARGAPLRLVVGALWRPVTGLAVAAALGVMVGAAMPASVDSITTGNGTDTEIASVLTTSVSFDPDASP